MTGSLRVTGSITQSGTNTTASFSGLVGIGTTTPAYNLDVTGTGRFTSNLLVSNTYANNPALNVLDTTYSSNVVLRPNSTSYNPAVGTTTNHTFQIITNNTNSIWIDTAQNVGIGTSGPTQLLHLQKDQAATTTLLIQNTSDASGAAAELRFFGNTGLGALKNGQQVSFVRGSGGIDWAIGQLADSDDFVIAGGTNQGDGKPSLTAAERMRITSGGWTKISNNGTYPGVASPYHEIVSNQNNNAAVVVTNSNNTYPYGVYMIFTGTSPNDSTRWFYNAEDTTATRFVVRSNGGIANYTANDVNLSDERVKKDISLLGSYWDKFKAIEIVKFKYKDQTHDDFNIGVIAQQVEEVAPEFVDIDGFGKTPEDGIPLKSIYEADLNHATIKVLQEAMTKIEEQQIQIQNLQSQIDELKNK